MKDETILIITAIIGIVVLESVNLVKGGYDGAILSSVIGALTGLISHIVTKIYYSQRAQKAQKC